MTDTQDNQAVMRPHAPGIMISYRELVTIREQLVATNAKLDTALALKAVTDDHEQRLRYLERSGNRNDGGNTVMKHVWTAVVALGGALIGAIVPGLLHLVH